MTIPITSFKGDYAFLSNFFPSPVQYEGEEYPTVEHAYQAAKTECKEERRTIQLARTPAMAKALGRRVPMRPDWEGVKLDIMEQLLRFKFCHSTPRAKWLVATAPRMLIEGNTWGDKFWGVSGGSGMNHLGVLLMKIREELMHVGA